MRLTNTSLRCAAAIGCAAFVLSLAPASFARVPRTKIHRVLSGEDRKDKERTEKTKDDSKDSSKDQSPDKGAQ
jgi:hypothetical protein